MALPNPKDRAILMGPIAKIGAALKNQLKSLKPGSKDYLVGVDGGTGLWFKLGRQPDLAVGDWDSATPAEKKRILQSVRHLTLPTQKDRSDLFYALAASMHTGARNFVCLGVTGGRPDHHLGVLLELMQVASGELGPVEGVCALGTDADYYFLSESLSEWTAHLPEGTAVSVFPFSGSAHGVDLEGFEYPLKEGALLPSSQGLSNWTVESKVTVRLRKGRLLVVVLPSTGGGRAKRPSGKRSKKTR